MAAYPRKQTLLIFTLCALVTGGTAFYVYGQNSGSTTSATTQNVASAILSTATSTKIVSNDDWKKQFLEASKGTDYKTTASANAKAVKEAPLTTTDILGRNFLAKYAQLHQAGLTTDDQTVSDLMSQAILDSTANLPEPKTYSSKDIVTIPNNTRSISDYRNIIDAVAKEYSAREDEAAVATNAFEIEDMTTLSKIDPIIAQYKKLIGRLLATPVPVAFIQHHIELLNGMSAGLYSAQAFRHIDTDTLMGFAAVRVNAVSFAQINKALYDIKNTLA